jgi:hypothetical protein
MLYKGVFWYVENELLSFLIPCNESGEVIGESEYPLNSKSGGNYNHKLLWESLPKNITGGKAFNYYPRGRMEIKNGKASVFLNPDINEEDIQNKIVERFGLTKENGINKVTFLSDGSNHYKYIK